MDALRAAERLEIDSDEGRLVLAHGRVVLGESEMTDGEEPDLGVPPGRAEADELMLVSRWLQQARNVRCHDAIGVAATRLPAVASYASVRDD